MKLHFLTLPEHERRLYYELRCRVVEWKSRFFGSSWASYGLAKPGTFRLVPPTECRPALRRDYQLMRDMYLGEPTSFDEILSDLSKLEQCINAAGTSLVGV